MRLRHSDRLGARVDDPVVPDQPGAHGPDGQTQWDTHGGMAAWNPITPPTARAMHKDS
jgi:hypothetical protein